MSSPSKVKGSRWELDCAYCLRELGLLHMEREYGAGRQKDVGDLRGLPGFVWECKAGAWRWEFMDELLREMENADAEMGAVLLKRRGRSAVQGAAVLPIPLLVHLLRDAGWVPEPTKLSEKRSA